MIETEIHKPEPPKHKRDWFQFSLRTMLIAVTLLTDESFATSVDGSSSKRMLIRCFLDC